MIRPGGRQLAGRLAHCVSAASCHRQRQHCQEIPPQHDMTTSNSKMDNNWPHLACILSEALSDGKHLLISQLALLSEFYKDSHSANVARHQHRSSTEPAEHFLWTTAHPIWPPL